MSKWLAEQIRFGDQDEARLKNFNSILRDPEKRALDDWEWEEEPHSELQRVFV